MRRILNVHWHSHGTLSQSGKAIMETRIPVAFQKVFHTEAEWDLHTVEQPNAAGKVRYWPRGKSNWFFATLHGVLIELTQGKMLGGCEFVCEAFRRFADSYQCRLLHQCTNVSRFRKGYGLTGSNAYYHRFHAGAPSDYDEWAVGNLEGSEAWKFSEFQK